jgi:ureidoacrylate peracid hydrolase
MALEVMDIKSAALLVIDMQNGFVHEKGTLGISGLDTRRLAAVVPAQKRLIERCRQVGIPVIWTVQERFEVDASRAQKKLAAPAGGRH